MFCVRTFNSLCWTCSRILIVSGFSVGLENGWISSLNKRFLDPRRPVVPTADDREEGLVPYKAGLELDPRKVLSYNLEVK